MSAQGLSVTMAKNFGLVGGAGLKPLDQFDVFLYEK
jgi:hypothetical protein